ncbi:MAG: hypothetical protein ACOC9D_01860, partial [Thermodesulfobacteriota bacterium]
VGLDLEIRKSFQDKTKAGDFVLEFLFGRSLIQTLPGFGLEVRETGRGYRFLATDRGVGAGNDPFVLKKR